MNNPSRVAFTLFGRDVYWYGVLMALGILIGVLGAAGRAGVPADDTVGLLDHVPVAGVIAATLVLVEQHLNLVGLPQHSAEQVAPFGVPVVRLRLERNGADQADVRVRCTGIQHGFGRPEVKAPAHARDEVHIARVDCVFDRAAQVAAQRVQIIRLAPVIKGQLFGTAPGETTGVCAVSHAVASFQKSRNFVRYLYDTILRLRLQEENTRRNRISPVSRRVHTVLAKRTEN